MRVVFTVLAALPLLMPEGMCFCQLLPRGVVGLPSTGPSAASARSAVAEPGASGEVSRCACKRHRKDRTPDEEGVSAGSLGASCHCPHCPDRQQDQHPPGPSGHLPGCPAVHAVSVVLQGIETDASAGKALLVWLFVDVLRGAELSGPPDLLLASRPPHRLAPPLFLSHCALLI